MWQAFLRWRSSSPTSLVLIDLVSIDLLVAGVPFYSERQLPRAPCPLCTIERYDYSEKALFFVNGTSKGEYDSRIPDGYFKTPPLKLTDKGVDFGALRVGPPRTDVCKCLICSSSNIFHLFALVSKQGNRLSGIERRLSNGRIRRQRLYAL